MCTVVVISDFDPTGKVKPIDNLCGTKKKRKKNVESHRSLDAVDDDHHLETTFRSTDGWTFAGNLFRRRLLGEMNGQLVRRPN